METSGRSTGPNVSGITGLNTSQMMNQSNFAGFDFSVSGPWAIINATSGWNGTYPYHQWRFTTTPVVVSGNVFNQNNATLAPNTSTQVNLVKIASAGQVIETIGLGAGAANTSGRGFYYRLLDSSYNDQPILVYSTTLSGTASSNGSANTLLKTSGAYAANITNLNSNISSTNYQVIAQSLGASPANITNAEFGTAEGSLTDPNLLYSVSGNDITLLNNVNNTNNSSFLISSGTPFNLSGNITTTNNSSAKIRSDGTITLVADSTLVSPTITFNNIVNGPFALTINPNGTVIPSGTVIFNNPVGGTSPLSALNVGASATTGTTSILSNVTTTGSQTYYGTTNVTSDPILNTGASGNVTINSTQSTSSSNLTVNAGNISIGPVTGLNNLVLNSDGFTNLTGYINNTASVTTNATGKTDINANVNTTGEQTYNDIVNLSSNVILNGSNITFVNVLNGEGWDLTVNASNISLSNVSGANNVALNATSFSNITGPISTTASLTTNAGGTTDLNANVSTSGAQTYNDEVVLTANTFLSSGSTISFTNTTAPLQGAGFNLNITAVTDIILQAVNNTGIFNLTSSNLTSLLGTITNTSTLNATGPTNINASINTTGAQTYNNAVNLINDANLNSSVEKSIMTRVSDVNRSIVGLISRSVNNVTSN